jgi:hypothetical protein
VKEKLVDQLRDAIGRLRYHGYDEEADAVCEAVALLEKEESA